MKKEVKGNILVFLASLCLAFSTISTHIVVQDLNPIVLAFYMFLFTILFLFILRLMVFGYKSLSSVIKISYKNLFFINITTAVDWLFYLIALKYIDGSLVNAIVFGLFPLGNLVLSFSFSRIKYLLSFIILILLFVIGINYINLNQGMGEHFWLAIFYCIIVGIAVGGAFVSKS